MRLLVGAKLDPGLLHILLKLLDGILERGPGVVDLVNDQHALSNQVVDLAEGGEVEPLRARNLGAWLFDDVGRQALIQRKADGLNGNVGAAGRLEEAAQDPGRHVAAATDGDQQLRLDG